MTTTFPGKPGLVHLPVKRMRVLTGVNPTVIVTECGLTGIAHVRWRAGINCKECRKTLTTNEEEL